MSEVEQNLTKSQKKYLINLIRDNRVSGNGYHRKLVGSLTTEGLYPERAQAVRDEHFWHELADKLEETLNKG